MIVTPTQSDMEFLALACRRNATAGKQLDESDKKKMALRLYNGGEGTDKEEIAEILSVKFETVRDKYLADVERQLKEQRERTMHDMWLACYTQQEIAEAVGVGQKTVDDFVSELADFGRPVGKSLKSSALYEVANWSPQLYQIWSFPKLTNPVKVFGSIPQEILDNLLYYYTNPFDVVLDPFAGGGMTIDVCKRRLRRYWASDLTPIVERQLKEQRVQAASAAVLAP